MAHCPSDAPQPGPNHPSEDQAGAGAELVAAQSAQVLLAAVSTAGSLEVADQSAQVLVAVKSAGKELASPVGFPR